MATRQVSLGRRDEDVKTGTIVREWLVLGEPGPLPPGGGLEGVQRGHVTIGCPSSGR